MPPWSAVSGYGHFANDMSLTAREVSLILAWADGGAPRACCSPMKTSRRSSFLVADGNRARPTRSSKVAENRSRSRLTGSRRAIRRRDRPEESRWFRALQLNPADRTRVRYAAVYESRRAAGWAHGRQDSRSAACRPAGRQLAAGAKLAVEIGYRGNCRNGFRWGRARTVFPREAPPQSPRALVDLAGGGHGRRRQERPSRSRRNDVEGCDHVPRPSGRGSVPAAVARGHRDSADGAVEPLLWLKNYRADGRRRTSSANRYPCRRHAPGDDGLLRQRTATRFRPARSLPHAFTPSRQAATLGP